MFEPLILSISKAEESGGLQVVNVIAVMQHRATVYPNGMHDIPKMLDKE